MADLLAIISKAVFEKAAGKDVAAGQSLGMDRYVSTNKALEPLAGGGKLYLVTARPGDILWLVAILDRPKFDGAQWVATKSTIAITDITSLVTKLRFEAGTWLRFKPGQLGMSLQTPRKLSKDDVALLDAAVGATPAPPPDDIAVSSGGRSDAVLGAVLSDPDDDAARQVLADALMQRNDPRGELILVELALAGPLAIRKRDQLVRRRDELLRDHAKTWFPYKLAGYRTARGFLSAVTGTLSQINAAEEMFAKEPIVEVKVTGVDDGAKLAKAKWLPRVRHLIVRGEIGDEGLAALCASKSTAKLQVLNLTNTGLSGEGIEALAGTLPACTNLCLTGNEIGDDGVAALAGWTSLTTVQKLYLSACGISDEGVGALFAKGAPLSALQKLCLSKNDDLGDEGAGAIAANASKLPALRLLELASTGVGIDGVEALMKSKLPASARVDVRRTGVGVGDAAKFGERVRAGDGRD